MVSFMAYDFKTSYLGGGTFAGVSWLSGNLCKILAVILWCLQSVFWGNSPHKKTKVDIERCAIGFNLPLPPIPIIFLRLIPTFEARITLDCGKVDFFEK
jgi:hypothetical protein